MIDGDAIDGDAARAQVQREVARASRGAEGARDHAGADGRARRRRSGERGLRRREGAAPASSSACTARRFGCPPTITQDELLAIVDRLNADPAVHGILVQMPLPKQIDSDAVIRRIRPDKDVDGFHPVNVGKLLIGETRRLRAVHAGRRAATCCRRVGVTTRGRRSASIVGRSNIVGKPMAALMVQPGRCRLHGDGRATAARAISPTHTRRADILIVAAGEPEMVTARHGEAGRGRDRRRHESHSRRDEEERHAARRRRRSSTTCARSRRRSRRCRAAWAR